MEAKELMIGDWVICSDPTPFRITGIYNKEPYVVTDEDGLDVEIGDLKPIPLTEEIFKANGFILRGKTSVEDNDIYYGVYVDAHQKAYEIHYRHCDGQLRIFWKNYLFGIKYVHELQHALRLCGLTELADSFRLTK